MKLGINTFLWTAAFDESNLDTKRPGTGLSPAQWDEVVGRVAKRDFGEDELIEL